MATAVTDFHDGFTITGARTGTNGPFRMQGGTYMMIATAASTSSNLQILSADGTTYVNVGASTTLTTTAATAVIQLPPCIVQVVFVATSDVAYSVVKVPLDPNL